MEDTRVCSNTREGRELQLSCDLIAEYKDLTCLWDVRCKDYCNLSGLLCLKRNLFMINY